ncbi:hypothetical protein [Sediminispirochaeta bajacaliforniensis]|uniref:hypothetical protein n=1 Tax=Sediminispirochaeta bajacaliforniensis TaxID=148 RepID=UPI000382C2C9|nr:hypothetical protein [Sediminispirochaeta bajacaliforniensis]
MDKRGRQKRCKKLLVLILFTLMAGRLWSGPFWIDLESGGAFTGYNDVQIPSDTGTRFSLADDLDPDAVWFFRLRLGADFGRHSVSFLYAPLRITSNGSVNKDITFRDTLFPAGTNLEGTYIFNSYRLTWSYALIDERRFRFEAGITGKIRDASIELKSESDEEIRKNLGFVPLIHLDARWNIAERYSFVISGDGLAAPQGRAEDFMAALLYRPEPDIELRLGYRILEGGSDGGGEVYTFGMFHYILAGIRYRL